MPSERRPPNPSEQEDAQPPAHAGRSISIWQPHHDHWRRPAPSPLGDHHATRRELTPKRPDGPKRLCWFGESAAAGYLLAPHRTPAQLFEHHLRTAAPDHPWEVVDLARTNERLATLAATVEAAAQLEPDALVVYAGNNWTLLETPEVSPYAPSVAARQDLAAALRAGGPVEAARLARRRMAERAAGALERVAAVARELAIPVLLVLPEVELTRWETRQPPVHLPGDGTARWFAHLETAHNALANGDSGRAETAVWRMIDLDGGTCPTPFRLLATARRAAGDVAGAREAAVSEIDAVHPPLLAFLAAPQAGSAPRRVLAAAAERHGWATVDLRAVLGGMEQPRPFLDYCHLSAAGMARATAAVAAELLRRTGGADPDPAALAAAAPLLAAAAEAQGWLAAAAHTAHRHLPVSDRRDLLRDACHHALGLAGATAATAMLDLADARTAPAPELLTAGQRQTLCSAAPWLLQHGWRWDGLDADLLCAMADALTAREMAAEACEIRRLLTSRRALPAGGAELARPPADGATLSALAEPLARFYPEAMAPPGLDGRATLRCPWPETGFHFVAGDGGVRALRLRLTMRLPEALAPGAVQLLLDGVPAGRVTAGPDWCRASLRLPAVAPGLHRLALRWPAPPAAGAEPLEPALRELEVGREADLHPVFGELFSLRVEPLS